jgi:hypothetical protein
MNQCEKDREIRDSIVCRRRRMMVNTAAEAIGFSIFNYSEEDLIFQVGMIQAMQRNPRVAAKFQQAALVEDELEQVEINIRPLILTRRRLQMINPAQVRADDARLEAMGYVLYTRCEQDLILRVGVREAIFRNPRIAAKYRHARLLGQQHQAAMAPRVGPSFPQPSTQQTQIPGTLSRRPESQRTPSYRRSTQRLLSQKLQSSRTEFRSIYVGISQGGPNDEGTGDPHLKEDREDLLDEEIDRFIDPVRFDADLEKDKQLGWKEPSKEQKLLWFRVGRIKAFARDQDLARKCLNNSAVLDKKNRRK